MQQADRAHSATEAFASPDNSNPISAFMTSRRSLLTGTFGAIGAAAVVSPLAATSITKRPWDVALARYRSAKLAADRFRASHYDPAWQRIDASAGPRPAATAVVRAPGLPARKVPVERSMGYPAKPEYDAARAAQTAWQLWWDRHSVAENQNREIIRRQEALWTREDAARQTLMAEPAPDAAALAVKILLTFEEEEIWEHEREAVAQDARRLAA